MGLPFKDIYARLQERFPAPATAVVDNLAGDPFCVVDAVRIVDACRFLRDEPFLQMDYPTLLSGADDGKDLWVVYHLYSIPKGHRAVLKVKCDRARPSVPTVTGVWKGMDWHERETYDMYGIVFDGHPDLRRILLPEDWEGHPLRKDYEFPEQHGGIPLR